MPSLPVGPPPCVANHNTQMTLASSKYLKVMAPITTFVSSFFFLPLDFLVDFFCPSCLQKQDCKCSLSKNRSTNRTVIQVVLTCELGRVEITNFLGKFLWNIVVCARWEVQPSPTTSNLETCLFPFCNNSTANSQSAGVGQICVSLYRMGCQTH